MDSVFGPIIRMAESPLIPVERIESDQDAIEESAVAQMVSILNSQALLLLERMEPALDSGSVRAINEATWPVKQLLQPVLFELWSDGFLLGGEHGIEAMQAGAVNAVQASRMRFRLDPDLIAEIDGIMGMEPAQLINVDAVQAVVERVNLLAGDFADDVFLELRKHLVSAIVPQPDTGEPISRPQLIERIQSELGIGENRAKIIARTELTSAYNQGRLQSFNDSDLVDYVRFLAISDDRTTDICRTRDGMLIPKSDTGTIAFNTPPLHYQCRSTLSPVMSRLSRFEEMVTDPSRDPQNRDLVPLPQGWRVA